MSPALMMLAAAGGALALLVGPSLGTRVLSAMAPATALAMPWIAPRRRAVVGVSLLAVALGAVVLVTRPLLAVALAALAAMAVTTAPRVLVARRHQVLAAQLAPAAQVIGASCEAGLSLRAAIDTACDELSEPVVGELGRVRSTLELGGRADDAVRDFGERVGTADARLFAAVISVQRRSGGDLGRSLRALGDRIEGRHRLARELRSVTAQARSTAVIVIVLPLVAAVAAEVAAPGAVSGLASTPAGIAVLTASIAVQGFGLVLVRLISRVPA